MKYTEEMILHSDSGYCMPFAEPDGRDVSLSLGYGEQNHPESGERFSTTASTSACGVTCCPPWPAVSCRV